MLKIYTNRKDYTDFGIALRSITQKDIKVVTKADAQFCLKCGFSLEDLIEVDHSMKAANKAPIRIDGVILVKLGGMNDSGQLIEAAVMVHLSRFQAILLI